MSVSKERGKQVSDFSRVNQRLLQAKFLLQHAQIQSQQLLSPIQIEALVNSVLWHLQLSLIFYARELGSYSKLKNAWQLNSLSDLQQHLQQQNKSSQAVDEIINLQSMRGSWLYRLQKAVQSRYESEAPQAETKAFVKDTRQKAIAENRIAIVDLNEDDDIHLDDLELTIRELTQLIQRQRLVLAEF